MVFIKYQHVEHVTADEVEGLLDGEVHIFPKLDGSNKGVYLEDGKLRTMSRNIGLDENHEFTKYVRAHPRIEQFLRDHPGYRLYGEWMDPHNIKTYEPDTWYKWFVFDVTVEDSESRGGCVHIPYDEYVPMLEEYGILYVQLIERLNNPDIETLKDIADNKATLFMQEGRSGEGIVIKNYKFVNKYGRQTWAKIINSEYTAAKYLRKDLGSDSTVEERMAADLVTPELVAKEYAKIKDITPEPAIPARLLGTVYHCVVVEELWNALKKHKDPIVDFRRLKRECEKRTKAYMPDLYGKV